MVQDITKNSEVRTLRLRVLLELITRFLVSVEYKETTTGLSVGEWILYISGQAGT